MAKVKKMKAEKVVQSPVEQTQMNAFAYFPSLIYTIEEPRFLETARIVAREYLREARKNHSIIDCRFVCIPHQKKSWNSMPMSWSILRSIKDASWRIRAMTFRTFHWKTTRWEHSHGMSSLAMTARKGIPLPILLRSTRMLLSLAAPCHGSNWLWWTVYGPRHCSGPHGLIRQIPAKDGPR